MLVGTGPRGGDGMDQLAPDVAPLFGTVYEPQDLMWLPIFFSPSEASQAAGRQGPGRAEHGAERPGQGGGQRCHQDRSGHYRAGD